MNNPKLLDLLFAIFAAIFMGTIGLVSRYTQLDAETITLFRLGLGAVFLLAWVMLTGSVRVFAIRPAWQLVISGAFLAGFIVFYIQAMQYTSMANAIMMIYLAPLAASVFAHFFMGEHLTRYNYLLVALALFGFAMMLEFRLDFNADEELMIGLGFGLLSLVTYAGYILVTRVLPKGAHVYNRTFYQLLIGALCMLPFALGNSFPSTSTGWGWLVFAGLVPGFLAILFAVRALNALPSALFGTLAYCEPVTVVMIGWVLFDETLSLLQLAGCAVIITSGLAQAHLFTRKRKPEVAAALP